ncbi:MAG: translation initiation factor IF-2 subunit beta [Candidatus Aenigmatarchaeota archaeon]|nr:MAG: translation initiation factor IF-2 subunit beta [Candidatus Aenigmarchaeota archaeon]
MEYQEMLKRAMEKINKERFDRSRFEVPEPDVTFQGNRTILVNFGDIAKALRRSESHFMKFLLRELAVPGNRDGKRAIFLGRFNKNYIKSKVEKYMESYVLCPVCGKPDTNLVEEEGIVKIKCEACGTKVAARRIK